ncbi:IS5 family transposase [Massilibacteroides sp.]|uniref:IS5 family transposase n=1 Tax=Massilibacteroides sp. TaxID=2034766 RepID=UPI00260E0E5E|nr:IS5 family transposase [Massilibacteroides sp.]MDD4515216.1 IS5 family transposase [Massilibacteroides sp.]
MTLFEVTKLRIKMYQTNITETEWQYITKVLDLKGSRKRKYDLRMIWNAIFYLVKTGCQWRMLPKYFPKWESVYYYYRKRSSLDVFDLLLEQLRGDIRVKQQQNREPSLGIIDSQSIKRGNNYSLNGIDGNKKIKGIKRHVVVDKNDFLIAVMVTIANIHDSKAAYLLMRVLKELCSGVKVLFADGGYRGELIESVKNKFGYLIQVVVSAYKEQGFRPIHKNVTGYSPCKEKHLLSSLKKLVSMRWNAIC